MRPLTTPLPAGRPRGFTLIELLCVVAIAAVLAALAYPSFHQMVLKTRRADALAAVAQLQAAQERHRANHAGYASLAELPAPPASSHYTVTVEAATTTGYSLLVVAKGSQAADLGCRHLRLDVEGLNGVRASGPTAAHDNPPEANRRCWQL